MTKPDPRLELVPVFESDDFVSFELAKAALDEAGVDYFVEEDPPARFGFSPILFPMRRILMPAYRRDQALELIAGADSREDMADDPQI